MMLRYWTALLVGLLFAGLEGFALNNSSTAPSGGTACLQRSKNHLKYFAISTHNSLETSLALLHTAKKIPVGNGFETFIPASAQEICATSTSYNPSLSIRVRRPALLGTVGLRI